MGLFNRNDKVTAAAVFDAPTAVLEDLSGDYTLDPSHTRIGFSARHAMVTTVRGAFKQFEGTATIDTATPANSKVSLKIDTPRSTPATPTATPTCARPTSSAPTSIPRCTSSRPASPWRETS
jgi:hypothetical protein